MRVKCYIFKNFANWLSNIGSRKSALWEYFHHGNQQTRQIRAAMPRELVVKHQHTTASEHWHLDTAWFKRASRGTRGTGEERAPPFAGWDQRTLRGSVLCGLGISWWMLEGWGGSASRTSGCPSTPAAALSCLGSGSWGSFAPFTSVCARCGQLHNSQSPGQHENAGLLVQKQETAFSHGPSLSTTPGLLYLLFNVMFSLAWGYLWGKCHAPWSPGVSPGRWLGTQGRHDPLGCPCPGPHPEWGQRWSLRGDTRGWLSTHPVEGRGGGRRHCRCTRALISGCTLHWPIELHLRNTNSKIKLRTIL